MKISQVESLGVSVSELEAAKAEFEKMGHTYQYFTDVPQNEDELIARIGDAEILNISNIKVTSRVIEACKNLKYINVAFTGVDHIDLEACKKHNIKVSNAAGYSTEAVSELAVGLALALLRNFSQMDNNTRSSKTRNNYLGTELCGKTVGIVGTGSIGLATAKIFMAFGCEILAYSRTKKQIDGINYVSLDTLFEKSDIVSLHIPANTQTKNLINADLLSMMKPTAIIINTARGPVMDNAARAELLKSGKIAGAGIDVYENEPPLASDYPLLDAPNTVLLPHVGYASKEAMQKRFRVVKANLNSFLKGSQENVIL
ncbi:MAG: hydroxyacid dehydrogenase [Bacteroidales bacterium]|nr:hydroxyacid dehydrogenase [Bacteroidales bacterium]